MTPATARSHRRIARAAPRAPRAPRRVSGPGRSAGPSPSPARRRSRSRAAARPVRLGRVRALPDHRLVDRLLRSRAVDLGARHRLLGGIVAMQVSLLKLNSGISRAVETTTTLERQNAELEARSRELAATDRDRDRAPSALGMLMPAAGDVGYLHGAARATPTRAVAPDAAAERDGRRAAGQPRDRAGLARRADRRRAPADAGRATAPAATTTTTPASPRWRPPRRPPRPGHDRAAQTATPHAAHDDVRPGGRRARSPVRASRGADRAAHRPALRGLPRHARARRRACRLARRRRGRHAQDAPPPPSRRPTSSSPPGAARSPTPTAPSWRSPSPRRRSRRRRTWSRTRRRPPRSSRTVLAHAARTSCCASSRAATPASSTSPAASPPRARAARRRSWASRGSSSSPSTAATTRATGWRRSCSATSAPTGHGLVRARVQPRRRSCAARTASAGSSSDALGDTIELREVKRTVAGRATCGSRSTRTSRTTPRRCWPRSARSGSPRARPRS